MGVVQITLEDRLFELPPSPQLLTLADKLDAVTHVSNLPDLIEPKCDHWLGPQSPEDKMMPQPLPHDEKESAETQSPEDKMLPQPLPHDEKEFAETEVIHEN